MGTHYESITREVMAEIERSIQKHGEQRHLPLGTGHDSRPLAFIYDVLHRNDVRASYIAASARTFTKARSQNEGGDGTITWKDILLEEVFEALSEDDPAAIRAEFVQVAAVALKIIDAIDAAEPVS